MEKIQIVNIKGDDHKTKGRAGRNLTLEFSVWGGVLKTEICPTISKSSWEHNCVLIEIYDNTRANKLCDKGKK